MTVTGIEQTPAFTIIWWAIAFVSIGAALLVVLLNDLLKAALALVVCFLAIAGHFVMLQAEFLAVVQLLIYAGAIPILVIFAVLVMKDVERGNPFNQFRIPGLLVSGTLLLMVLFAIFSTDWNLLEDASLSAESTSRILVTFANTASALGELLLTDFVLAVEMAAVLLLASMLGAIALVRDR
jgi:NADH:ubiquinone oxidoreductase subunit 6 (subunit J)